jgi:hypothetical protein
MIFGLTATEVIPWRSFKIELLKSMNLRTIADLHLLLYIMPCSRKIRNPKDFQL